MSVLKNLINPKRALKTLTQPFTDPKGAFKSLISRGGLPGGPKLGQLDPAGLLGDKKKTKLF